MGKIIENNRIKILRHINLLFEKIEKKSENYTTRQRHDKWKKKLLAK